MLKRSLSMIAATALAVGTIATAFAYPPFNGPAPVSLQGMAARSNGTWASLMIGGAMQIGMNHARGYEWVHAFRNQHCPRGFVLIGGANATVNVTERAWRNRQGIIVMTMQATGNSMGVLNPNPNPAILHLEPISPEVEITRLGLAPNNNNIWGAHITSRRSRIFTSIRRFSTANEGPWLASDGSTVLIDADADATAGFTPICQRQMAMAPGVCGDQFVDADMLEECDDGNAVNGDGCSAACQIERDTDPVMTMQTVNTVCGNSAVEQGEECDDGNVVNGDGCSSLCLYDSTAMSITQTCGNGILETETGEQCDDGNAIDGDGCSVACSLETPPTVCGNLICEADETSMTCPTDCMGGSSSSSSSLSPLPPPPPMGYCGDLIVQTPETCDDGNMINGDGCSMTCEIE